MNINNQMYNLFKNMKQAYANNDDGAVEQYARCWMQLATENPFVYDTPEHEEFFQMQKCYNIWAKGAIDQKINRRRMVQHAKALCALNPKQPYVYDKQADIEEQRAKQEAQKKLEEKKAEENDVQYMINRMNDAYLKNDETEFQQNVMHLMDIAEENPFLTGMDEYEQFSLMMNSHKKVPMNKKRLFEAAKNLCNVINYTEIYPEKTKKVITDTTVLGVVPEKKSRFGFFRSKKKAGD